VRWRLWVKQEWRTTGRLIIRFGFLENGFIFSSIFRCQMAGCDVETVGEARMEDHWEADHNDRLVEEWVYEVLQN
jgi:hypothetical protein